MSKPSEHLNFQYSELSRINSALRSMRGWGVLESDPGFQRLWKARGAAIAKIGIKAPRITTLIAKLIGLSPGELKLWEDAEIGWMVETRAKAGAPPVYRYVSDAIAERIVKKTLTHEEFMEITSVDDYEGE